MMPIAPRVPMAAPGGQPPMQGGAVAAPRPMAPGSSQDMNPMNLMGLLQKIRGGAPAPAAPMAPGAPV